jgi:predicted membrane chloride channel (bestrophin family)
MPPEIVSSSNLTFPRPQEIIWRLCIVLSLNVALVVLSMVADIKIPTFTTVPHTLIGLPLGLLLVFRTNSAYARLRIFR